MGFGATFVGTGEHHPITLVKFNFNLGEISEDVLKDE
jgi:hypothetical protein